MLALPNTESRAALRAFWLVMTLSAAGLALAVGQLVGLSSAAALVPLLAAPVGLARPRLALPPYRAWNRLAGLVARAARLWLSLVCFLVLAAAGLPGSRMRWSPATEAESGWQDRKVRVPVPRRAGKLGALLIWALRPRNAWSLGLLPLLWLMRAVAPGERNIVHHHIYTLY